MNDIDITKELVSWQRTENSTIHKDSIKRDLDTIQREKR